LNRFWAQVSPGNNVAKASTVRVLVNERAICILWVVITTS
jgi:hypothetical protein